MRKYSYFASNLREGWPRAEELERYFLAPPGQEWFFETRNDSAGFAAEGVEGTEESPRQPDRIDVKLSLWGHPDLGVLLVYSKWGGGYENTYSSRGDVSRLQEWVRSFHGDPLPVGLFVPFATAWKAVKEFIETDGALPESIAWVSNRELPPGTFPDP